MTTTPTDQVGWLHQLLKSGQTPEELRPEIIRTMHELRHHPDPKVQAVLRKLNKAVGGRVNLSPDQFARTK